jgi:RimJ/RimL family protein N-acetyltransferase
MTAVLIGAQDRHFAWMLGAGKAPIGLRLPPGGVDETATLEMLRRLAAGLRGDGCRAFWMVAAGREVVGLCSYKHLPDADGTVEFGYGIAESRRSQGHGTAAVAALIKKARRDPAVKRLIAETVPNNLASIRVLEQNGFSRIGTRLDPHDGVLVVWEHALARQSLYPHPRRLHHALRVLIMAHPRKKSPARQGRAGE